MDGIKEILEDKGFRVLNNTPYCETYRNTHENCLGCSSEKGCKKRYQIGMILQICSKAKNDTPQQIKDNYDWFVKEVDKIIEEK